MRTTDLWAGAILALLAGVALFWIIPQYTTPAQSELDLSPALVPSVAMWTCFLLSMWLIRKGLPLGHKHGDHVDEEFGDEASGVGPRELANFGSWVLASVVTMVLLYTVGFMLAGFVLLATVMLYARLRSYWLLVSIAMVVPVLLYWVVWFGFTIELP